MKRIVIAGGSGFLGSLLIQHLNSHTEEIVVLGRKPKPNGIKTRFEQWDGQTISKWIEEVDGCDVLINLTGRSVDCRYTAKNKADILNSRVASTKILGTAVQKANNPPKLWINASTATIYRHSTDKQMDETSGEIGSGFSVDVAKKWEKTFFSIDTPKTRKVAIRTSIVFGRTGGALLPIKNLVNLGFGGKQGDGTQFVSWIHEKDFARSFSFIVQNKEITGPVNLAAPSPVTNEILMQKMRKVMGIPFGIPLNQNLLEIGAKIIKTETELILKSRNVVPKKMLDAGFEHSFGNLDDALTDLLGQIS